MFFVITAAAVGFIYLYVVPQLRSSLTAEKLGRLEQIAAGQSERLEVAMRRGVSEARLRALLADVDQRSGTRVTILGVRNGASGPEPAFVVADSQLDRTAVAPGYPAAAAALINSSAAGAVEGVGDGRLGQTAVPLSVRATLTRACAGSSSPRCAPRSTA